MQANGRTLVLTYSFLDVPPIMGDETVSWDEAAVISERLDLQLSSVNRTIQLLDDGNTVPFIARYRREVTNSLDADQIRCIKNNSEELR